MPAAVVSGAPAAATAAATAAAAALLDSAIADAGGVLMRSWPRSRVEASFEGEAATEVAVLAATEGLGEAAGGGERTVSGGGGRGGAGANVTVNETVVPRGAGAPSCCWKKSIADAVVSGARLTARPPTESCAEVALDEGASRSMSLRIIGSAISSPTVPSIAITSPQSGLAERCTELFHSLRPPSFRETIGLGGAPATPPTSPSALRIITSRVPR